jgi:chromosome segregation ATPase
MKHIITGPDIDKLANGIYSPVVTALTEDLAKVQKQYRELRKQLHQARKDQRAATNTAESLLRDLASSRANRMKLVRENARLKTQLINAGITPDVKEEE